MKKPKEYNFYKDRFKRKYRDFNRSLEYNNEGRKGNRLRDEIQKLKTINLDEEGKPLFHRNAGDFQLLKNYIKDLCFIAYREGKNNKTGNEKGKDYSQASRDHSRKLFKQLPEQINAIESFIKFFKDYPELDDEVCVTLSDKAKEYLKVNNPRINAEKLIYEIPSLRKDLLPHLRGYLKLKLEQKKDIFSNSLSNSLSSDRRFLLLCNKPIQPQGEHGEPVIVSLEFTLVFLLRRYCDSKLKGNDWHNNLNRPMHRSPQKRKKMEFYGLTGRIVNAAGLYPAGMEFSAKKVRDRLKKPEKDCVLS